MNISPNLFTIGASKCGSTFLHGLLAQHPEICMSVIKEPSFFNDNDYESRFGWYLSLFEHCRNIKFLGESSPLYSETTYFKNVPQRIFDFNSKARIIYIVREPFSRFNSVYKQTMSSGHWARKKYYDTLMPKEFRKAVFSYPPFLEATKYWTHIQNYRQYFSDEQIKVVFYEDLIGSPRSSLVDIFHFLSIDEFVEINVEGTNKNSSFDKKQYSVIRSKLSDILPTRFKSRVPSKFKNSITHLIARPLPQILDLNSEDIDRVKAVLAPEIESLYSFLGTTNDPWQFFKESE